MILCRSDSAMNEFEFLQAIAQAPDDKLLRQAFADWLEERSDPRAAWVRNDTIWEFMAPDASDPVPRIIEALKPREDEDWDYDESLCRERAAEALAYIGEKGVPAVPVLLEVLELSQERYGRLCGLAAIALGN